MHATKRESYHGNRYYERGLNLSHTNFAPTWIKLGEVSKTIEQRGRRRKLDKSEREDEHSTTCSLSSSPSIVHCLRSTTQELDLKKSGKKTPLNLVHYLNYFF